MIIGVLPQTSGPSLRSRFRKPQVAFPQTAGPNLRSSIGKLQAQTSGRLHALNYDPGTTRLAAAASPILFPLEMSPRNQIYGDLFSSTPNPSLAPDATIAATTAARLAVSDSANAASTHCVCNLRLLIGAAVY